MNAEKLELAKRLQLSITDAKDDLEVLKKELPSTTLYIPIKHIDDDVVGSIREAAVDSLQVNIKRMEKEFADM